MSYNNADEEDSYICKTCSMYKDENLQLYREIASLRSQLKACDQDAVRTVSIKKLQVFDLPKFYFTI